MTYFKTLFTKVKDVTTSLKDKAIALKDKLPKTSDTVYFDREGNLVQRDRGVDKDRPKDK